VSQNSHSKEVASQKDHILFEIHKREKDLETRLAQAKENAKRIVTDAKVEADNIVKKAREDRLKKELALIEAELAKQEELRKVTVVDDKEEVRLLKAGIDKNHKKAVDLVMSRILPEV